ncbi:putative siderophore iron transporter mirb protein [Neofusicoccum parvum UCRNP2]|uniref:Putative siderophore iron transporter mirb protein n=1 Tax=Botryosphaeria parva (strain UCR-NP2) TaxID=1287680 RepID=R1ERW8_BOTPV|nr:putative siderophore iron transporter mirb protein [Neofusicoccum parvum UCRNP2]
MILRQRSFDRALGDRRPDHSRASSPDIPGEDAPLLMDVERDHPDDPPQQGVREIEAARSVWTPGLLKIAYLSVFVVILGSSLETQASANLTNYVTSDFSEHALVSTISVSTSLVAGVARVPVAKLIDIWGRGLILMAACNNVFYWLGFDGAGYVLQVFLADTTSLRNRALAFSLSTTPYILTTFAGPAVAQWFQDNSSWRWAYIIFAIITPLVSLPIIYLLFYTKRIAIRKGILKPNELKRKEPWLVQAQKFAIQFDVVGSVLFVIGLALILLPLSLRSHSPAGWLDLSMISKFIAGYSCLCLFVAWEWKFAPVKLIPYRVIMDRTVLGSCLLCFVSFAAFSCYNAYFPAYLQVVHELTIRTAGYIANIFSITSCILGIAFAYIIRQTGRYKQLALLALPLRALGTLALIPAARRW